MPCRDVIAAQRQPPEPELHSGKRCRGVRIRAGRLVELGRALLVAEPEGDLGLQELRAEVLAAGLPVARYSGLTPSRFANSWRIWSEGTRAPASIRET